MMASGEFELYKDAGGKYRWRLRDANGVEIAASGESFDSKSNAKRAAENVRDSAAGARIEDSDSEG